MPIASILESNKPFVFTTTHSNRSSTELGTSSTTATQSNSSASPLERGPYYHPSLSGGDYSSNSRYNNIAANHQTLNGRRIPSHYQGQQTQRPDVYKYPSTENSIEFNDITYPPSTSISSPITSNSQRESSSKSAGAVMFSLSTIKTPSPTQLHSAFPSQTSVTHPKDTPYPLSRTSSLIDHSQSSPTEHHHHAKLEDTNLVAPLCTNSNSTLTSFPASPLSTITGTTGAAVTVSPLKTTTTDVPLTLHGNPTLTTTNSAKHPVIGQFDEGELGYFDGSPTENRRVKRRKELTQRIDSLNSDFSISKDRIFTKKLLMVQNEVVQARNNTHRQFHENLVQLETIRQKTIEDGRLFLNYQTQVADNQFTLEIQRAEEEYRIEKQEVRGKLFAALEEKRRKLKEDKDNCDLAYDAPLETQTRMNKRNLRKRGMDNGDGKLNKRKQASGPALVFKLNEGEVYSDLQAMRNGLIIPVKKSSANKKK